MKYDEVKHLKSFDIGFKIVNLIKILITNAINLSILTQIKVYIFKSFFLLFLNFRYSFDLSNFYLIGIIQKLARFEIQKLDKKIGRFC